MPKNLFIDASHPNQTRVVLKSEIDIEDKMLLKNLSLKKD